MLRWGNHLLLRGNYIWKTWSLLKKERSQAHIAFYCLNNYKIWTWGSECCCKNVQEHPFIIIWRLQTSVTCMDVQGRAIDEVCSFKVREHHAVWNWKDKPCLKLTDTLPDGQVKPSAQWTGRVWWTASGSRKKDYSCHDMVFLTDPGFLKCCIGTSERLLADSCAYIILKSVLQREHGFIRSVLDRSCPVTKIKICHFHNIAVDTFAGPGTASDFRLHIDLKDLMIENTPTFRLALCFICFIVWACRICAPKHHLVKLQDAWKHEWRRPIRLSYCSARIEWLGSHLQESLHRMKT